MVSTGIPSGVDNPLTKKQKAFLVQLARKAYEHCKVSSAGISFQDWRRDIQMLTVGTDSLTRCTQGDFRALRRAFEQRSGQMKKAFRTVMKEDFENIDQARHRLRKEIEKCKDVWEDPQAWAEGMLKRKRGHSDLNKASQEDLWHIIKTMSSRAAKIRRER